MMNGSYIAALIVWCQRPELLRIPATSSLGSLQFLPANPFLAPLWKSGPVLTPARPVPIIPTRPILERCYLRCR